MKIRFFLLAMFLVSAVYAQDVSENQQLANKLIDVINYQEMMENTIDQMVDTQASTTPALANYEDVLKSFLKKYLLSDSLKTEYANIYAEEFTNDELKGLIEFYNSDLGQKMVVKMPALMQRGMSLGQESMMKHKDELIQMINEKMQQSDRTTVE